MTMIQIEARTVSEILRATRALAGLTTREIAPQIGVSHAAVARWERGEGEPSVTQFMKWARATRQPVQQLVAGIDLEAETAPADAEAVSSLSQHSVRPKGLEPLTF